MLQIVLPYAASITPTLPVGAPNIRANDMERVSMKSLNLGKSADGIVDAGARRLRSGARRQISGGGDFGVVAVCALGWQVFECSASARACSRRPRSTACSASPPVPQKPPVGAHVGGRGLAVSHDQPVVGRLVASKQRAWSCRPTCTTRTTSRRSRRSRPWCARRCTAAAAAAAAAGCRRGRGRRRGSSRSGPEERDGLEAGLRRPDEEGFAGVGVGRPVLGGRHHRRDVALTDVGDDHTSVSSWCIP